MSEVLDRLAELTARPANVLAALAALFAVLAAGSAVRLVILLHPKGAPEQRRARVGSLLTWWVLAGAVAGVVLAGRGAAAALFAAVSLYGLREFRDLARRYPVAPRHWELVFLAVPVHYLFAYAGWYGPFWVFVPVGVLVLLLTRLALAGETEGFLIAAAVPVLGLMLVAVLPSHAVLLLTLPAEVNPAAGPWGLLLYLLVLTAVSDIVQALWGRRFGRHRIAPRVSPNKTWEGFVVGAAATVALACAAAPVLTPFADRTARVGGTELGVPYLPAVAAGVLVAVGGFFGGLTFSAIKRGAGVKDSGTLLPGQGGVLDRIDSLTFTAPLFFYFTATLYGPPRWDQP